MQLPLRHLSAQYVVERVIGALERLDRTVLDEIVDRLVAAQRSGNTVWLAGNGGSAATAAHLACDLRYAQGRSQNLAVVCLTDNVPVLSALANDLGYPEVFRAQLRDRLAAEDVLVLFSVSAASENVVLAAETARARGATVIGIFGSRQGRAVTLADLCLCTGDDDFAVSESVHAVVAHALGKAFQQRLAAHEP